MLIKERRDRAGLTLEGLARRVGCSKGLMSQIENGKAIENTGFGIAMSIARVLGIDPFEMMDLSSIRPELAPPISNVRRIVVLDAIQVLSFAYSGMDTKDYSDMPVISVQGDLADSLSREGYALKIEGTDNMPDYRAGDQVVVDPDDKYQPGEMVVARIEGLDEAVLRTYRPRGIDSAGQVIELSPINADHPSYTIDKDNAGSILGVVVKHIRDPRPK